MADKSAKASVSPESYIGCFISLISKSEIRYEGVVCLLNAQESTIGLRNVKSYGTEGRRKDGPQVLPSEEVYDHVFFRGNDIKDLHVVSSSPAQSSTDVLDDPAIIQAHYAYPASPAQSFSVNMVPVIDLNSNMQSGISSPAFHSNLPVWQSGVNSGSFSSLSHPPSISNELSTSATSGCYMPPRGIFNLPQQPFPQLAQGLVASDHINQMQNPKSNASLAEGALNSTMLPQWLLPPVCCVPENIISAVTLPSAFSLGLSIVPSSLPLNTVPFNAPDNLPTSTLGSSLPLLSSVTPTVNIDSNMPQISERPKPVTGSSSPNQAISGSFTSNAVTSVASESHLASSSLATPCLLQDAGVAAASSAHSLEFSHQNMDAIQRLASEQHSSNSTDDQGLPSSGLKGTQSSSSFGSKDLQKSALHLLSTPTKKPDAAASHPYHNTKLRRNYPPNVGPLYSSQRSGVGTKRRENPVNGASTVHGTYNQKSHVVVRGNGVKFNRAALLAHHTNRSHIRGRANVTNGAVSQTQHQGARRNNWVPAKVTKFTEDFDFEAMNEKFNKQEVWGHLGRSNKVELHDAQDEVGELSKLNTKAVYVKDEFFYSLSFDSINHVMGKGKVKKSEQIRKDTETFGSVERHHHGTGNQPQDMLSRDSIGGQGHGRGMRGYFGGWGHGRGTRGHGPKVRGRVT